MAMAIPSWRLKFVSIYPSVSTSHIASHEVVASSNLEAYKCNCEWGEGDGIKAIERPNSSQEKCFYVFSPYHVLYRSVSFRTDSNGDSKDGSIGVSQRTCNPASLSECSTSLWWVMVGNFPFLISCLIQSLFSSTLVLRSVSKSSPTEKCDRCERISKHNWVAE